MEKHLCTKHGKQCMLKTGLREGPTYGKHFFICGVTADRCDYVKESPESGMMDCLVHARSPVELRTLYHSTSKNEKRLFYRCKEGAQEKLPWCGNSLQDSRKSHNSPLADVDLNAGGEMRRGPLSGGRAGEERSRRSDPGHVQKDGTRKLEGKWSKSSSHIKHEIRSNQSSATVNPRGKIADVADIPHHRTRPDTATSKLDSSDSKTSIPHHRAVPDSKTSIPHHSTVPDSKKSSEAASMPDFATISLQRKLKDFSLEGNESLLVSPRSGQLKYRSEIRKDAASDSESETGEEEIRSYPESEEEQDDCQITAVESPRIEPKPALSSSTSSTVNSQQSAAPPSSTASTATGHQGAPPATKVLTFKTIAERDAYIAQLQKTGSGRVVNVGQSGVIQGSSDARQTLSKCLSERAYLVKTRDKQMQLWKTVNKTMLPDGGAKLQNLLKDLNEKINKLDVMIAEREKQVSLLPDTEPEAVGEDVTSEQATVGGMRQMKLTDMVNLSPHAFNQMYAANPQMMTLYGGRMTAARLREVGSVTTEAIERLHKQLETMPAADEEMEDPRKVKVTLMTHQRQALSWLLWREQQQHPCGGILADDMGLGKTLTMISLILKDKEARKALKKARRQEEEEEEEEEEGGEEGKGWTSKEKQLKKLDKSLVESESTLVVCPASLVHQWSKEIERRCSRSALRVILYHGPNRETDVHALAGSDVVLTTYSIVGREVGAPADAKSKSVTDMPAKDGEEAEDGKEQPNMLRVAWRRIILDEAHSIKNHKSLTAMSVCRLRAGRRWALTGTPIQNDLLDMYSLLRFLRCSPFDELKVWKRQVDNRSNTGQKRLNTLIKTLLLRRTKDQTDKQGEKLVALPEKQVVTHELELSEDERKIYEKIFQQSKTTLLTYLDRAEEKQHLKEQGVKNPNPWSGVDSPGRGVGQGSGTGQPGSGQPGGGQRGGQQTGGSQILLMLLRLRQCCSHLSLTKENLDTEALEKEDGIDLDIVEQMRLMALKEESALKEPNATNKTTSFSPDTPSSKISSLLDHLIEIRDDKSKGRPQKSVIVSQWTQMLLIVERHVKKVGLRCATIRGDIPPKRRAEMVDAFNSDRDGPEVMLLSLRAGGVGLNLIGGNHLFLIDMHWNPALEAQACDRIYRVGQKLDVNIHRFICKDTIEEKILQLQRKKTDLANNVLSGAKASANKLSLQDLKMLFNLDQPEPRFPPSTGYLRSPTYTETQSNYQAPLNYHRTTAAPSGQPANYRPIKPATFQPGSR